MSSQVVGVHQARLRELPGLVRLVAAKFLEHDGRHQSGGRLLRARRRAEVVVGAWGEMLSDDVWTDTVHDAVVCETPERRKARFFVAVFAVALLFSPLAAPPRRRGHRPDLRGHHLPVRARGDPGPSAIPAAPAWGRRADVPGPQRPGAGRALLEARCEAADARQGWRCLDAPAALENYYGRSGFQKAGEPDAAPGRAVIYMERAPRAS